MAGSVPMTLYTGIIEVHTTKKRELVDVTEQTREHVRRSGVRLGICSLYAQGATAALMIQENDDPRIADDVLDCLARLVPAGIWRHDRIDDNGAAHIQAGLVGPSQTVPIRDADLALSTWQNIFLCDFDGPRSRRVIMLTIFGA
jgi:secondary thiamine-phosphate synthase enzyme